ncbi:MAG: acetyl-CoA acetyltransferase [Dehalococcoidales bacterium]|nr:acetyl-CoA acetyltransferase [Dehalococcoidales bacterium]
MESIKDRVAIVGMGCCKFGERWDAGPEDLLVESCFEAFEDAGIEPKDIQAAWFGTTQLATGQPLAQALKLEYIPITRIENACATATDALMNACFAVAAGVYDIVLVAGVEKLKDSGVGYLTGGGGQPSSQIAAAAPPPVQFALAANRYFHQYGLSYEEGKRLLAMIDVKNHHNGSLNPKAHFQREITIEQAVNAPMMAFPLGLYDCCGVSDGSAAAILTRPDIAKSMRNDYVLVKGLGLAVGGMQGMLREYYDFVHFDESVIAGKMAYEQAGIKNPREEVDLAEVHDCFSITELIIYEDMGWSPRGRAKEDIESGFFTLEGGLPVNPDGGLKSFGHPIGASGIRMLYEVYKQLQGKAGPRQLKKADIGLTHNLGGRPGSFSCGVSIWGRKS